MLTEFSKIIRVFQFKRCLIKMTDVNIYVAGDDFSIHVNIFNNKKIEDKFIFILRLGENKTTRDATNPFIDYSYGNKSINYLTKNQKTNYIDLRNGDHEADAWLEGNQIGMSIPLKNFKNPNQKNRI